MSNPFTTVGLKNVSTGTPAPTIWVNDIPGISSELAAALCTSDAPAALAVWEKVQRLGLEKLTSLIENELSKSADFRYDITRTTLPASGGEQQIDPSTAYIGVLLTVPFAPYQEVYLDYIALSSLGTETIDDVLLVVVDLNTGGILYDAKINIEPGYNGIDLVKYFPMSPTGQDSKLFVGVRCDALTLLAFGQQQWATQDSRYVLKPVYYPIGHGKLTYGNPFSAAGVQATVRNSLAGVIKRYADRLGWAYAYVCASLLMSEKLASPNFNLYTNTNRAFTEEQIPALMDEAVTRIKPIARDMLKELNRVEAVTPKGDRPFDAGYSVDSFAC